MDAKCELLIKKERTMSTLDQPLLIANSNYHVGHQIAIFVAKEQGFFHEEGLKEYEYDSRGLIPGPIERDGLAMAIKNHGVYIATAVDVEAAIYQRSLGADLYIVGGWRYTPFLKWYGARHVTDMSKLRGGRVGMREKERDWCRCSLRTRSVKRVSIRTPKSTGFMIRSSVTATIPLIWRCSAPERSMPLPRSRLFPISWRTKATP